MRISQQSSAVSRQSGLPEACIQNNDRGLALIVVLWLMALITIIVTQFAFSMKVEMELTRNYKDQIMAYHLAVAGFHQAVMEIMNPRNEWTGSPEGTLVFGLRENEEETEPEALEKTPVNREFIIAGQGKCKYVSIDEEGKLDLNWLANKRYRKILAKFLEAAAGVVDQEADEIIDSIYDWVDKNDAYRLNGAEDDYYQSLDPPYHCKNGPFDTVNDLLLVKGITQEIFYGGGTGGKKKYEGLAKDLTVWNRRGKYNKSTASMTVLTALEGDKEKAIEKWENMFDEEGKPVKKFRSATYQIISTGESFDGSSKRIVKAAVSTSGVGGGRPSYNILYWNDNYIPPEPE